MGDTTEHTTCPDSAALALADWRTTIFGPPEAEAMTWAPYAIRVTDTPPEGTPA